MALKSGKVGFTTINATQYKFEEYTIDIDGDLPDMSHFGAGGGVVLVDGVTVNEIQLSGPYDVGAMPLTRGSVEYTVAVGFDVGLSLSATCRVKKISINNKYKDGPRITVTVQASNGTGFVASIS